MSTRQFIRQTHRIFLASALASTLSLNSPNITQCQQQTIDPTWSSRWTPNSAKRPQGKDPGFHLKQINWVVQKHGQHLKGKVLVPLCGKTLDMPYLASLPQTTEVVGVEGVPQALNEFMSEQSPAFQWFPFGADGEFTRWQGTANSGRRGLITFLLGDFFQMGKAGSPTAMQNFDSVWDRGGLVAVDPTLRAAYIDTIGRCLRPGGVMLFCAMDRREGTAEARSSGPPFSISAADAKWMFEGAGWVESVTVLDDKDLWPTEGKRWKSLGLDSMHEVIILIKKKM